MAREPTHVKTGSASVNLLSGNSFGGYTAGVRSDFEQRPLGAQSVAVGGSWY